MRILFPAALICFAASACSETTQVSDDLQESQTDASNPTGRTERVGANPGERPVRIGEGGPRFDACQAMGRVTGLRQADLDVLIAPFDAAERKAGLSAGQLVHICTRSHDQQWLGIVYDDTAPAEGDNPAANGSQDCGVSSPVRSKRNYDGPCKSGWVESTFVKLVAG
ncbi:hypothetical protein J4G78_15995 [Parasphingorhabdus cellanae]|uniref:Integron n=2 Tax=Parasphingorhabdus cellanae TaxID=2806553 RepID=A0ABX7TAS7_9SPHN|nr:hypothetical protein J4G78_15995 [Parasphingorhabdus cellanae]